MKKIKLKTLVKITNRINVSLFFCLLTMVILANKEKAMQTGFTWDIDSKNIAAIFTMTDENGRLRNIELMESVFQDLMVVVADQNLE